ncbi:phosphatidylserine/phosphatidylglycerophosphate/cardiolipin synthase family protein [Rubripirellula obstinata]|uniref:phosphatidylserine/phosphatidylglycerophosphate/ cardiolipin synthase family protein n=1 Tax=Rubripirellula obstinata TaxID=406547 RepID=UPI00122D3C5C|nr:phosphatidylserine/phosphatidylglycerophosphate/cardiolipin synthase family protein [Rubripirellula obstinata]
MDAWVPPENAGDPIGVLATSFTFDAAFFEEECLASFLGLETNPTDDGPAYLIEREDKLARLQCASVLVDAHHCRGSRSLRWDLLPARLPGIQHAKVSLLVWSNHVRLMIGSANLTEDGYRRNLEVFGVLDFHAGSDSPIECLLETASFLRRVVRYSSTTTPAALRWNTLIDRVESDCAGWGTRETDRKRPAVQVKTLFVEPASKAGDVGDSGFDQLEEIWPAGVGPKSADIVSPFFDPPESKNTPVDRIWQLLRSRGEVTVGYHVAGEQCVGWEELGHSRWVLQAPESLRRTPRQSAVVEFARVTAPDSRPLHAKGIWLQDDRYAAYQIGSSNFTSAGMGIGKRSNLEANLVYVLDSKRDEKLFKAVEATFPKSEVVDAADVTWQPPPNEEDADALEQLALPGFFGDAVYSLDASDGNSASDNGVVSLEFVGNRSEAFSLSIEGTEEAWFDCQRWKAAGSPAKVTLPWTKTRPPSGFEVRLGDQAGTAWWPVNVASPESLPPPDELKDLPLSVLMDLLGSSRPLHRVMADYLSRKSKANHDEVVTAIDPHKRVDTSGFLLQRTRRLSWALTRMRERVERPAATIETLHWRLHGPVGVMALAEAIAREATSPTESAFLIAELTLELSRANVVACEGCVDVAVHRSEVQELCGKLRTLIEADGGTNAPANLQAYVASVFDEVTA